jgi:hypothetical protein
VTTTRCTILIRRERSTRALPVIQPDLADEIVSTILLDHPDARSCNDGAAGADCDYLVFLNNDTLPHAGWLDALVDYADAHPEVGAVGAKMLFPDGTVQHAGLVFGHDCYPRHAYAGFPADHSAVTQSRRFAAVTGACVLFRREAFVEAGGFDPRFHNGYEDVDLCLRLADHGWEVHFCADSVVTHLESATRTSERYEELNLLFLERWGDRIRPDDLDLYCADGLLQFHYNELAPNRLSISPALATIDDEERSRDGLPHLDRQAARIVTLLRTRGELAVELHQLDRPAPQFSCASPHGRQLVEAFRDGLVARAQGTPPLADDAVGPTIAALVVSDWSAGTCNDGLSTAAVEDREISAALLRTAEVVGRWLGENADRVPRSLGDRLSAIGGNPFVALPQSTTDSHE